MVEAECQFPRIALSKIEQPSPAMLRRYMHKLGAALYMGKALRRKKQVEGASMSIDFSSVQKNPYVKIILAGGLVELYYGAITAGRIMEKYPGMTVARPDIFKHPNESLVRPDEELLPGEKFYLVPTSTVRKLRRKYQFREERESTEVLKALETRRMEWSRPIEGGANEGKQETEEQVCHAREFYVSKEKWSDFALKKCCEDDEKSVEKTRFTPPIKKAKSWRKLGWQPRLDSVEEVSP